VNGKYCVCVVAITAGTPPTDRVLPLPSRGMPKPAICPGTPPSGEATKSALYWTYELQEKKLGLSTSDAIRKEHLDVDGARSAAGWRGDRQCVRGVDMG